MTKIFTAFFLLALSMTGEVAVAKEKKRAPASSHAGCFAVVVPNVSDKFSRLMAEAVSLSDCLAASEGGQKFAPVPGEDRRITMGIESLSPEQVPFEYRHAAGTYHIFDGHIVAVERNRR